VERLEVANSAALGAALIAAAAGGLERVSLQETFCKPSSGPPIAPDTSLAGKYSTALAEFGKLLQQTIHARPTK